MVTRKSVPLPAAVILPRSPFPSLPLTDRPARRGHRSLMRTHSRFWRAPVFLNPACRVNDCISLSCLRPPFLGKVRRRPRRASRELGRLRKLRCRSRRQRQRGRDRSRDPPGRLDGLTAQRYRLAHDAAARTTTRTPAWVASPVPAWGAGDRPPPVSRRAEPGLLSVTMSVTMTGSKATRDSSRGSGSLPPRAYGAPVGCVRCPAPRPCNRPGRSRYPGRRRPARVGSA